MGVFKIESTREGASALDTSTLGGDPGHTNQVTVHVVTWYSKTHQALSSSQIPGTLHSSPRPLTG